MVQVDESDGTSSAPQPPVTPLRICAVVILKSLIWSPLRRGSHHLTITEGSALAAMSLILRVPYPQKTHFIICHRSWFFWWLCSSGGLVSADVNGVVSGMRRYLRALLRFVFVLVCSCVPLQVRLPKNYFSSFVYSFNHVHQKAHWQNDSILPSAINWRRNTHTHHSINASVGNNGGLSDEYSKTGRTEEVGAYWQVSF